MNPDTLKLIEALASKLGTTADMLWSALLRQAPIEGYCNLALLTFWWTVSIALLALAWRTYKNAEKRGVYDMDPYIALVCLGVLPVVIAVIATVAMTSSIIAAFCNPEYWALQQLLRH